MKRICTKCKNHIAKHHRWRTVYHHFLFWAWGTFEHRDCSRPTEIHKYVKRLKGEVPLPFDEPGPLVSMWGDKIPTVQEMQTALIHKKDVN
jgi:hypothetical protein